MVIHGEAATIELLMHSAIHIALFTAALLGFRHGFDYDHIAAITDVVSVQSSRAAGMRLGMIYALGHGLMVAALGSLVMLLGVSLPAGLDLWAERLVGVTLLILGLYVLGTLLLNPRGALPKSRYHLLHQGYHRIRLAFQRTDTPSSQLPSVSRNFDGRSVFVIGVIHGLGAETPTQLMVFLLAANLGGAASGLLVMATFLVGMLTMNALMTASATGLFGMSQRHPAMLRLISAATGVYSVVMGLLFLLGRSSLLPALN